MMFRHLMAKATPAALAALTFCLPAQNALAFNTTKVMNVIKFPNRQNHTVLISHRGIVASGCPENSTCSLQRLTSSGKIEAIELDIKSSASGGLWMMHDQNLGRMTQPGYNMYRNTGPNPDIRTRSDASLSRLRLKDRNGRMTNFYLRTLGQGLQNTRGVVAILDLKTEADARRASKIVRIMGAQNRVILKLSGGWYINSPLPAIRNTTAGVPYAVTLYSGNLDAIHTRYDRRNAGIPVVSLSRWISDAVNSDIRHFMFLEVGNKQQVGGDPLNWVVQGYKGTAIPLSQFIPVPEYPQPFGDGINNQLGYVRSNSSCCAKMSDYLTSTRYFGSEKWDDRPNLHINGGWAAFDSLLTDDVLPFHNVLTARNRRHLNLLR